MCSSNAIFGPFIFTVHQFTRSSSRQFKDLLITVQILYSKYLYVGFACFKVISEDHRARDFLHVWEKFFPTPETIFRERLNVKLHIVYKKQNFTNKSLISLIKLKFRIKRVSLKRLGAVSIQKHFLQFGVNDFARIMRWTGRCSNGPIKINRYINACIIRFLSFHVGESGKCFVRNFKEKLYRKHRQGSDVEFFFFFFHFFSTFFSMKSVALVQNVWHVLRQVFWAIKYWTWKVINLFRLFGGWELKNHFSFTSGVMNEYSWL